MAIFPAPTGEIRLACFEKYRIGPDTFLGVCEKRLAETVEYHLSTCRWLVVLNAARKVALQTYTRSTRGAQQWMHFLRTKKIATAAFNCSVGKRKGASVF